MLYRDELAVIRLPQVRAQFPPRRPRQTSPTQPPPLPFDQAVLEAANAVLASAEPTAPPVRLVTAETIRGFLAANHIEVAPAQTGDAKASVVRMICVRK